MCDSECYRISAHYPLFKNLIEKLVIEIKSIFPTDENEKELVKFIARYQYLASKDLQFFSNSTYYPKRITRLVKNSILKRYGKYLVLGENGYNYIEILGQKKVQRNYNKTYVERLKFISHLAALYHKYKFITFTPSFEIKDKTVFTESSRKYIGVLSMSGIKYLIYHISKKHSQKYISSVIYDLQKENQYKNVIVLINDINRINLRDFIFGLHSVILCEDTDESLEKLKYLNQVNWNKCIYTLYKKNVHLSEYNFCDYTDKNHKYISYFYFIDTEKVNRIDNFLKNNLSKKVDIICEENIFEFLR